MSEQTNDFLQHYGIVGMKWGKRRGSLKSKVDGAQLERSQNTQKIIKRKLNGKSTLEEKIAFAPDRLLMGKKRHEKFLNKKLSQLEARDERVLSGKRNLSDKLEAAMNTTLFNLNVSRVDNKG